MLAVLRQGHGSLGLESTSTLVLDTNGYSVDNSVPVFAAILVSGVV